MILIRRFATDEEMKKTISNMEKWLEEAKKEGNQQRVETLEDVIKTAKTIILTRNN